jgi:hypothetical protein
MLWVWQRTNASNIDTEKYKIYSRRHGIHETSVTYGARFWFVLTYCLWDLRFSQHCCWRLKSSWGCVVRVIVIISKYLWELLACRCSVASHTTLIFYLSHVTMIVVSCLGAFENCEKGLSFLMSVHVSTWNYSAPTRRFFMKFYIWVFFEKLSRKLKFGENLTRVTGTLLEDVCTFMTICCWILLKMKNFSNVIETIKTHILCSVTSLSSLHPRKLCSLWYYGGMW